MRYLHDGANPIQLQDAAGTPTENLLAGSIDEWFARTTAGQTQSYLTDGVGSTLRLTDAQGNKLTDYTYDAYGTTSADSASTNHFQYAGRESDGFGLYYNRARYYKPSWGRFISQDPLGLVGGDNLYAYVGGNPISRIDPTGEGWKEILQAIGILSGLAGTPGIGPDTPHDPMQPSQQSPANPGAAPGRQLPDPQKSPTKIPELPRPSVPISPAPSAPATCPPKVPTVFRPPIPLFLCPTCFLFNPADYGDPGGA